MTEQVSIQLASNVVYVEGYVNGVLADFRLQENNVWTATVDKSNNDIYEVEIVAYNNSGLTVKVSTTLYYGLHLIYDRTSQDLYYMTEKAFYNATDLNRVESATDYIATLLNKYGYLKEKLTLKKDWNVLDFPVKSEMQRCLSNIYKLVDAFYLLKNSPTLPETMNDLDIVKANAVEKVLLDLNTLINNMEQNLAYSGEIYSGEGYFS